MIAITNFIFEACLYIWQVLFNLVWIVMAGIWMIISPVIMFIYQISMHYIPFICACAILFAIYVLLRNIKFKTKKSKKVVYPKTKWLGINPIVIDLTLLRLRFKLLRMKLVYFLLKLKTNSI